MAQAYGSSVRYLRLGPFSRARYGAGTAPRHTWRRALQHRLEHSGARWCLARRRRYPVLETCREIVGRRHGSAPGRKKADSDRAWPEASGLPAANQVPRQRFCTAAWQQASSDRASSSTVDSGHRPARPQQCEKPNATRVFRPRAHHERHPRRGRKLADSLRHICWKPSKTVAHGLARHRSNLLPGMAQAAPKLADREEIGGILIQTCAALSCGSMHRSL